MHVLGARFATPEAARSALREIVATLAVDAADVGVRPLGTTHYERPSDWHLLAGHFEDDQVEEAIALIRLHGGSIVSRRQERSPERATVRRAPQASQARQPQNAVARAIRTGLTRETATGHARPGRFEPRSPIVRGAAAARGASPRRPAAVRYRAAREQRLSP